MHLQGEHAAQNIFTQSLEIDTDVQDVYSSMLPAAQMHGSTAHLYFPGIAYSNRLRELGHMSRT